MGKLFWQISTTLDGFMEGPQRELARTADVVDEDFARYCSGMLRSIDGFVIGRKTYELFVSYWPTATGPDADRLDALPKLVASRTLSAANWNHARICADDAVEEIAAWKRKASGELAVFGSAMLAASLLRAGVIDEVRLLVTPFLLGAGTRTFAETNGMAGTAGWTLRGVERWRSGTVALTYETR